MLRKWMTAVVMAALLVVMVVGAAMAADDTPAAPYGPGQCTEFVDANGDGVCNNAPQNGTGNAYGRGGQGRHAGMGARNAAGQGQGQYRSDNFVDADGDGRCDLWQDEDGDGVNDSAPRNGTGNKHQRGGGRGRG